MDRILRFVMACAAASGIFLGFGWPFLVSRDPADPTFRLLALAAVIALLGSIAALLVLRARR